ncbi:type III pantothenate kinase [Paludibacterium paludis]|uniref:Type III pantothenate kinase n=1 Tax=Paludibacterium paludis TaxID=1225769 RepID=A0A918UA35_9NEIS|nr:type III pantothenate kinase [Paludibacterium paludis]GGY16006.1 hypothetical protein GCM10011289_19260 [Paludibacterium paludis]
MRLLIDAGNSRIKWGVHDGKAWVDGGVAEHDAIGTLAEVWRRHAIGTTLAANVAGQSVRDAIESVAPTVVNWIGAEARRDGVTNHYRQVAEQGADRWLAVLAARARYDQDIVVACAGTALTVEALTAEGEYLGGIILPGFRLMLGSLATGTAQLDRAPGEYADFPQGTSDALASGALDAMAGAIERMRRKLAERTGRELPRAILTGGDARRVAGMLAGKVDIVDNLVLEGILRVASAR